MSNKHLERRRNEQKRKKRKQIILISVLAIILLGTVIYTTIFAPPQDLGLEISVFEANEMREDGAFILDVREPSEWAEKHIPGSNLIPLGELALRLDEISEGQEIVVVCRSGNRSQSGRDILLSAGFESVTSMAGGINQWIMEGYEAEFGN